MALSVEDAGPNTSPVPPPACPTVTPITTEGVGVTLITAPPSEVTLMVFPWGGVMLMTLPGISSRGAGVSWQHLDAPHGVIQDHPVDVHGLEDPLVGSRTQVKRW
jgi:hypothetical protein